MEAKPIPGFGGKYRATSDGQIINIWTENTVAQCRHPRGYLSIYLASGDQRRRMLAHQAIALAFLGEPPAGHEVNHKNGIKTDNRPSNLEYATRLRNIRHAIEIGLARGSLCRADAKQIRRLRSQKHRVKDIATRFGVSKSHISKICHGKRYPAA